MSEPFLAEVRIVGFNFAPRGHAQCDGQIVPINQNQSLFALLGTTYGGDGETTFGLPELRGRTPIHFGNGHPLGSRTGEEGHILTAAEIPGHDHELQGTDADGTSPIAINNLLAAYNNGYGGAVDLISPEAGTIADTGQSQAHENMQPYLVINFVIALTGLFPSQT